MMKKTFNYMSLVLVVVLALGSCTHNNGDIGPWFGTWHVEDISDNGGKIVVFADLFFQFQNNICRTSLVTKENFIYESYGTWEEHDGKMIVDFPDSSVYNDFVPGIEVHNAFTVDKKSSREVTFTKTDVTGNTYTYHLRKQP